jgi:hypothetical protein
MPSVRKTSCVENHGSMRVAQSRHGARLSHETIRYVRVKSKLLLYDFDGDRPFESEVSGAVDGSHPAFADLAFDAKSPSNYVWNIHLDPLTGKGSLLSVRRRQKVSGTPTWAKRW